MTILFSSDLLGKIRSCGCTVDDTGGLGRRATYVEEIRAKDGHVLVLDAGDAFSIDLSYSQAEADLTWDAFNLMRLDAFTPGETELVFGLPYLERLAERAEFDILHLAKVANNHAFNVHIMPLVFLFETFTI